eukprot:SAG11_NODE_620_length_8171_cov_9.337339_5_plen_85_part_00
MESFDLNMLDSNLQRSNALVQAPSVQEGKALFPQSAGCWNLKPSIHSPSDWAQPTAAMARLGALVDISGGIVGRPVGTRCGSKT